MPRRPHLRAAVASLALALPVLAACGSSAPTVAGPLNIAAFKQTPGAAAKCAPIMAELPATLVHQKRTKSTGSAYAATWGDPAIVLRCGTPEPAGANAYASCLTVNKIDWFLQGAQPSMDDPPANQGLTVTTLYRSPAIEVTVPDSYGTQGPSTAMAELTAVIKAHTKVSNHCS